MYKGHLLLYLPYIYCYNIWTICIVLWIAMRRTLLPSILENTAHFLCLYYFWDCSSGRLIMFGYSARV